MTSYTYAELNKLYQTANGLPDSPHTRTMAAIAVLESSGNPNARNGSHYGLWQIAGAHTKDRGWSFGTNYFDPATNARMAEFVYKLQGYNAWTTYKNVGTVDTSGGSVATGNPALFGIPNPISGARDTLDAIKLLLDPGFWKRVGIGAVGATFVLVALVILLRKDVPTPSIPIRST